MNLSQILLFGGLVLLVGLFGRLLQQRTKLPESIFLILFGVLLGPILEIIPASEVLPFVPLVSTLALIVILLESGLSFEAHKLDYTLRSAIFLILLVGALTTIFVGGALHYVFGWEIYSALLIGLISSGTTTLTARTLLESTNADPHVRKIITLETIFNDITIVVGTMVLIEFMLSGQGGLAVPLRTIMSQFSVAIVLGAIFGWIWKGAMERLSGIKGLRYISTLGFCLTLYYIAEAVGGNPVLSIFAFSLVLGNHAKLHQHLFPSFQNQFAPALSQIKKVQGDFTFFMRSFFFFLLGVSFSFGLLAGPIPLIVFLIIAIILASRFISTSLLSLADPDVGRFRMLMTVMIPRGFVATVLAFVPAQRGIVIPLLTEIVLLLVFATTFVSIAGTFIYNLRTPNQAAKANPLISHLKPGKKKSS